MSPRRFNLIVATTICVLGSAGCLSIGGKSYTTQSNPETEARLVGLETRMDALEQQVLGSQAPTGYTGEATNSPWQVP
jgi:hypothetical protein